MLYVENIKDKVLNEQEFVLKNLTTGKEIPLILAESERRRKILLAGGLLNYTKKGGAL